LGSFVFLGFHRGENVTEKFAKKKRKLRSRGIVVYG
jgi:hypothetical protein